MKIIVGLGNPGAKYENTYHNVGFMAVDKLADSLGLKFSLKSKLLAMVAQGVYGGEKVVIVKPQTYMNLSGESVRAVLNFFKANLSDLIVIYDDLDIPNGAIRLRPNGSAGTHNGMRNIISQLQSGEFARLRIGTANDNPQVATIDYVLSKISDSRMKEIDKAITIAVNLSCDFIKGATIDKLMCAYNGKNQ